MAKQVSCTIIVESVSAKCYKIIVNSTPELPIWFS